MGSSPSSPAERFFCSAASQARGEEIFGTVGRSLNWLLVECPSVWRRRAIEDSSLFSPSLKAWVRSFDQESVGRTLLIRQEHQCEGPLRCFRVHCGWENPRMETATLREYDDLPQAQFTAAPDHALFAVCTHGRHDPCCAKFGLPVFCALRDVVADRAWQCSHIGGDRFAGNVVVFPYGIYYGRVTPETAPDVVSATERGEICLPLYRGRSCFSRPEQVADYYARRESGELAIDALYPVHTVVTGERYEVALNAKHGRTCIVSFRVRSQAFQGRLTCGADSESPVPQFELVSYTEQP
ncbi:MAG TPA: sucrase ferredoxin [Bryobacteraceae bacterium]|nr:sucrase ferredoxin [Bryobacteraceae bacterium]